MPTVPSLGPQPFTRLHPYLWRFMKEESEELLSDQDFDEPAENKFYWEVTKYIRCRGMLLQAVCSDVFSETGIAGS